MASFSRKTACRGASKEISCRSRSTACVAAVCKPLDICFEGAEPRLHRSRRLTGSTYSKFGCVAPNSLIFSKTARRGASKENSYRPRSAAREAAVCKPLDICFEVAEPRLNRSRRLTGSTYSKFRVLAPNGLIFRKTARRAASKDISCRSRSTACVANFCEPLDIYFDGVEPLPNRSRRLTGSTCSKFRV